MKYVECNVQRCTGLGGLVVILPPWTEGPMLPIRQSASTPNPPNPPIQNMWKHRFLEQRCESILNLSVSFLQSRAKVHFCGSSAEEWHRSPPQMALNCPASFLLTFKIGPINIFRDIDCRADFYFHFVRKRYFYSLGPQPTSAFNSWKQSILRAF